MPTQQPIALVFQPYRLGLQRKTLHKNDVQRTLRPQAYALLRFLAERSGQVVSTDDIAAHLWPDRSVNNHAQSIQKAIEVIRAALGVAEDEVIHKVPGGYQFVLPVTVAYATEATEMGTTTSPDQAQPAPTATSGQPEQPRSEFIDTLFNWIQRRRRLALMTATMAAALVLWPMLRTTATIEQPITLTMMAAPTVAIIPAIAAADVAETALLSLTEDIVTELRRTPKGYDLVIRAPIPIVHRELPIPISAKALDVRYFLRTTLKAHAGKRTVTVHLIEGLTGQQVWSAPFEQKGEGLKAQNLLAVQAARDIAVQIRTAENRRALPSAPVAGHYTLQGRVLLESERNAEINAKAKALFDMAVALDPKSIQAHLGYARSRVAAVANGWVTGAERAKALTEADRAVATVFDLDKTVAGAFLLRGSLARLNGNFDGAVAAFEQALLHNPNYVLAHAELGRVMFDMGRPRETIQHVERALELSPTDNVRAFWFYWAGMAAAQLDDFKASLNFMDAALAANARYHSPRPWQAIALVKLGRQEEATRVIKAHLEASPEFSIARWSQLLARGDKRIAERLEPFAVILRQLGVPAKS